MTSWSQVPAANFTLRKEDINLHTINLTNISRFGGRSLNVIISLSPVDGHTFPISVLLR